MGRTPGRPLLAEFLLALACSPRDGRLRDRGRSGFRVALAGAVLTELAIRGALTVNERRVTATRRVQRAVQGDPGQAAGLWATDPWSAGLASLAGACGLLPVSGGSRPQRRAERASLDAIRAADPIGRTVAAIIKSQSAQSAALAAQFRHAVVQPFLLS